MSDKNSANPSNVLFEAYARLVDDLESKVFIVEYNKLVDNKIRIWDIINKYTHEEFDQNFIYFDVEYMTTLRKDDTQRTVNHAFGHPARVGVDFVKI